MTTAVRSRPVSEWRDEALARFGRPGETVKSRDLWLRVSFRCPNCGHVASGKDFADLGQSPERGAQQCIGRFHPKGESGVGAKDRGFGCDWAAFGLFGTLNSGQLVDLGSGAPIWVFDFAEASSEEGK